eukprot:6175841-Pleurochrysis_carterae.AAC.1
MHARYASRSSISRSDQTRGLAASVAEREGRERGRQEAAKWSKMRQEKVACDEHAVGWRGCMGRAASVRACCSMPVLHRLSSSFAIADGVSETLSVGSAPRPTLRRAYATIDK